MILGRNIRAEPISVCHAELVAASAESPYRKYCPVCKLGILLVRRDPATFMLINVDNCSLCGQTVIYRDKFIGGEPVADVVQPN